MSKPDILGYPPTKEEQKIIATLRAIEYGSVTVKKQAGRIVLIEKSETEKVQG